MSTELIITLVIFVLTIIGFSCNKFTLGTVAIFAAIALEVTGVLTAAETWAGLANSTVVMMASMFLLGAGLSKTRLLSTLSRKMIKPGSADWQVMLALTVVNIVFCLFVNATAAITFMIPIIYQVCRDTGRDPIRLVQPCAIISMMWAGVVPLGGTAGLYMGINAQIGGMGGEGTLTYFSMMNTRIIPTVAATIVIILFYNKFTAKVRTRDIDLDALTSSAEKKNTLSPFQEKAVYVIFVATIIGIIVSALTDAYAIYVPGVIGAILMVALKILSPREVPQNCGLPVILLFAGTLALATALGKTGGAEIIGNLITKLLGGNKSPYFVCAVYFVVSTVLTQVMSNMAVLQIFSTLAIATGVVLGIDPGMLVMAVNAGSALAILTPMASASQAIGTEKGGYTMKQYFLGGLVPWLVYTVVFIIVTPLVY